MFPHFTVTVLISLPMVVLAAPAKPKPAKPAKAEPFSGCNVGTLSCCNEVYTISGNTNATAASGLLGIAANVLPLVGLNCDPISLLIGVGGNNCAAQPVCCTHNSFVGLASALDCLPLNVNL